MNFQQDGSIISGRDINSNNVLSTVVNIHQPPQPSPILPPLPRCPLPSQRFTGRAAELLKLERFFFSEDPENDKTIFSLIGMGGCGKSQISFRFTHVFVLKKTKFHPSMVFFLDASTTTTLDNSYIAIAKSKGIGETAQAARDWLANCNSPCFMLFDNTDDPKLNLRDYLPRSTNCYVLITTRLHNSGRIYGGGEESFIDLDALPQEDAEELLMRTAGVGENQRESVKILVNELHCHALAVVQAGAGIRVLHLSVDEYIQLYRRLHTALMNGKSDRVTANDLDDYPWHVTSTLQISYDKLDELERILFDLCAHLHHTGITEELFMKASSVLPAFNPNYPLSAGEEAALALLRRLLSSFASTDGSWDSLAFRGCVHNILALSLLRYDETRKYSIHPLIHDSLRQLAPDYLPAAFLLTLAQRQAGSDAVFRHTIVPHAERALSAGNEVDLHPEIAMSLGRTCINLDQGLKTESLHRAAWTKFEATLGSDHEDTLLAQSHLAKTLHSCGCYEEAEAMQRHVAEKRSSILGPDHRDTLTALAHLAATLFSRGRYAEAEPIERQIFEKLSVILGQDHPDTILAQSNLANTMRSCGRYEEVESMEREIVEKRTSILGPDHPDTVTALAQLTVTLFSRGRYEEAEPLQRQVLEKRTAILGPDHPHTILAQSYLANTVRFRGRYEESELMQRDVLEKRSLILGADHPDTITTLGNLAISILSCGRYEEAEPLQQQAFDKLSVVLGPDHPATTASQSNLATTMRARGRYEAAEAVQRSIFEKQSLTLGPDHRDTINALAHLAATLFTCGRYKEVEQAQRQVFEGRFSLLGPDHPDTILAQYNLAATMHSLALHDEAEQMMIQALQAGEKAFGAADPYAVAARERLARWRAERQETSTSQPSMPPVDLRLSKTASESAETTSLLSSYTPLFLRRFRDNSEPLREEI
jgi:tetratricopeptide (TPR) repeat protein